MVLVPSALAASLQTGWLPSDGGSFPASAAESGDTFAGTVADWFAAATAGAFPCTTAAARRPQLAAAAGGALAAGNPSVAGTQLALALTGYLTGQVFGPGTASPPAATSAAQTAFGAVFADVDSGVVQRADRIASGIHLLALSTIVVFPPVVGPPVPVT
ncbi:hypothetical protein [Cryptosporangium aurantiacum]|uniref:Uncharacterized protein n=1 Tax=Cryptosporangium aurantiacum TaxID=134849 RepID=A0A1M7P9X3_9ACTN|nr:hypothetical protein [Cryptosporangium aurantiacum]SHN13559.1 hypothetical protein SAMN05443668_103104 [Cryptosporangium aurantiacum]